MYNEKFNDVALEEKIVNSEELNESARNVTYTGEAVKISHIPRKDVIECGFMQDKVKVFLTFISTDASDFSENYSNEALTKIVESDSDCVEKFDSICELVLGKKFDRSIEDINTGSESEISHTSYGSDYQLLYTGIIYCFFYKNITVNVCIVEGGKNSKNPKIIEMAEKIIPYKGRYIDSKQELENM